MMTSRSMRRRKIVQSLAEDNEDFDRYVDVGVTLKIVRAARPGEQGEVLIDGARPMIVIDEKHLGGILDTKTTPSAIVPGADGISRNPQVWLCSEDQWKVIEHPDTDPIGKLAVGGMGAGKTTAGVIWVYLRWLESLGSCLEGGITAPTETRLSLVFNEIFRMFPRSWWQFRSSENMLTMCDGFRVRGVSTYQQSDAQGTRIAGFNWIWWLGDELQDQLEQFVHIQARLRSKADGRAKRLGTATEKDDPEWRTFKDSTLDAEFWMRQLMLGPSSPFIHPDHWASMAKMMTDRDYRRIVLAEDLPSESRLYSTFDRRFNLKPIPLGARKITSLVVGKKIGGGSCGVGMGHDPGVAKAATIWADAYELSRRAAEEYRVAPGDYVWFIRDELFTHGDTVEEHAVKALKRTRENFGCNVVQGGEIAHVRCQPLGSAEDKPDVSTLKTWTRVGFDIRVSQYSKHGKPVGHIKREDRIAVVNTLWCNAFGNRRMFLECDDRGVPKTPLLLDAIESMERDHLGRAERDEKNVKHDKSDLPAALGYWVWPFEKELATALRGEIKRAL